MATKYAKTTAKFTVSEGIASDECVCGHERSLHVVSEVRATVAGEANVSVGWSEPCVPCSVAAMSSDFLDLRREVECDEFLPA